MLRRVNEKSQIILYIRILYNVLGIYGDVVNKITWNERNLRKLS